MISRHACVPFIGACAKAHPRVPHRCVPPRLPPTPTHRTPSSQHTRRLPFSHVQALEGRHGATVAVVAQRLVKMKANAADAPYAFERGAPSAWEFELAYGRMDDFMPLAQQMLVASRLGRVEQEAFLGVRVLRSGGRAGGIPGGEGLA
jgi:hypothetical protein